MTEFNARNSYLNEKKPLECSISAQQGKEPTEKDTGTSIFVKRCIIGWICYVAVHAWHENRKRWVGDQSQRSKRITKDPIISCSWTTTYEGLLSTNEPFSEAIPLAEMVDFLVDIWHEEGLFD
ncbi:hypothetical protein SLE2022_068410 [Rubroshorea leprosula]